MSARRRKKRGIAEEVPVELRRLWGLPVTSRLGRPAELDVAQVVRAAVALADRDGLEGASLPRIARALKFTAMSLYRYVGSKSELLALMRDFAVGAPPAIAAPPGEWRDPLRRWACAERQLYHRRPWLPRIPISGPPAGPNQIAWMERALQILRGTGLGWDEKVGILLLVSGYVRQSALLSDDLKIGRKATGIDKAQTEQRYGRNLVKLIDPREFPEVAALFTSGLFEASSKGGGADPTADPDFTFGLERILDGVAAAIARKPATGA
jgi:AcrR family transcriptional regulator